MTIRLALTTPAVKRFVALAAVYVLVLQALFGAGAQLRVLLAETPGLCTILGFQEPDSPKHAADACTIHCVGQASQDNAALAGIAALFLAWAVWRLTQPPASRRNPPVALAYRGRGPPR